jgi:cytochrome c oxidase subunit IV
MAHDHAHDHGHGEAGHGKPKTALYLITAVILTIITAVEVWIFFIPAIKESAAFIPILLVLSAVKFAAVVMLYMHLKFDSKLFTQLFVGPLIIAGGTMVALLALFGQLSK